jgi:potassium-dependent mechanosensitive channel
MEISRELVKNISIFEDLTDEEFRELAGTADLLKIHSGDILFKQNEQSNAFYIILDGKLELLKSFKKGSPRRLTLLEHGDIFGEMSFISETRRTGTIKAISDSTLIRIKKKPFKESMRKGKNLATYKVIYKLSKLLSHKLTEMVKKMEEVYEKRSQEKQSTGFFPALKRVFLK